MTQSDSNQVFLNEYLIGDLSYGENYTILEFDPETVPVCLGENKLVIQSAETQLLEIYEFSLNADDVPEIEVQENYTSAGENIFFAVFPVTVTFANVTKDGYTDIISQTTNPKGNPPPDYRLLGYYTDVSTTADYVGTITVCIDYTGIVSENEANLRLLHWIGKWEDVTSSLDIENNTICGQVSHLSWFGLASYSPAVGGRAVPVNKAELVMPYIIASILACIAIVGIYLSKKR